jgi:hypothetical protein
MSEPTLAREPAPPEARRRKVLAVAGVLALVAAVAVLAVFVLRKKAPPAEPPPPEFFDEQLSDAVARVDQLDPGWRFADLEAAREKVPAEENAAPLVMACAILVPADLTRPDPTTRQRLSLLVRAHLRRGDLDADPREEIKPAQALLGEARKLAGFSRGRHAVKWDPTDPLATPLPHVGATEDVTDLLTLDAEVLAHEGKVEDALVSVRAALVAVHVIGDEPMLLTQVKRLVWQDLCVGSLEEVLRRGPGGEEKLLAVQKALEAEAAAPVMRTAARAERAGLHGLMTALERDELGRGELPRLDEVRREAVKLLRGRRRETLEAAHAWLLDYTTRFVEIAGRPPQEQAGPVKELAATTVTAPPEAMLLLGGVPVRDISETCQKAQARLRCAVAAVAAQRYRLANGRWPDDLAALVPNYLGAVPADPFNGKPLGFAAGREDATIFCAADTAFRLGKTEARGKPK